MSASLASHTHTVSGDGWRAEIHADHIYVTVSDEGDPLPAAIETLFAESQRRYWNAEVSHLDEHGRNVYLLTRGAPSLV